jgi:tetratricopeptide (TPR) repeat protein
MLHDRGDMEGAIAAYKEAIRLDPTLTVAHYNLGIALNARTDVEGAIASYRRAIQSDPSHAEAHCNLGHALQSQGQFAAALAALKRGHELGSKRPGWRYPSAAWVRGCEHLLALDGRLAAVLAGTARPESPVQRLAFAQLCAVKKQHAWAARFYAEAFALEPKWAADLGQPHRYNAACSAALAAAGRSKDAVESRPMQRLLLRRQALTWLRTEWRARQWQLKSGRPDQAAQARAALAHWQKDADLVGLRDAEALKALSAEERQACRRLWADVAALLGGPAAAHCLPTVTPARAAGRARIAFCSAAWQGPPRHGYTIRSNSGRRGRRVAGHRWNGPC